MLTLKLNFLVTNNETNEATGMDTEFEINNIQDMAIVNALIPDAIKEMLYINETPSEVASV